jgi:hypothetical protein
MWMAWVFFGAEVDKEQLLLVCLLPLPQCKCTTFSFYKIIVITLAIKPMT